MPLPKMGRGIMEWNCGNDIAEIGEFFFLKKVVAKIWGGI